MPRDTRPPGAVPSARRHRLRATAATGIANPPTVTSVDALPAVLFVADVARLLRCSTSTVVRRVMDGTFPVVPLPPIDCRLPLVAGPPARLDRRGPQSPPHTIRTGPAVLTSAENAFLARLSRD